MINLISVEVQLGLSPFDAIRHYSPCSISVLIYMGKMIVELIILVPAILKKASLFLKNVVVVYMSNEHVNLFVP